jgi:hypothetical protein
MSLTQSETVFASIHETALNDAIIAFTNARPHHLSYGSPAFAPVTTVAETSMAAIAFPGVPGGIQWRVRFSTPRVDLFKQSSALPPELTLGPGQFSARIDVEMCIECRKIRIDPKPPRPPKERGQGVNNPSVFNPPTTDPTRPGPADDKHPMSELTCFKLRVFAVGHLEHVLASTGEDAVVLAVDAVEIVDIKPDEIESFLECLLFLILQAALANIRLPLRALRVGAFQLSLTVGPLIEDDQIKVRGLV